MLNDALIRSQLPLVLQQSNFTFLAQPYIGKVRDSYLKGDTRYLITSDRLSCFDVVVTTVPFKGQVLNFLAEHWFKLSNDLVENHVIDIPDPNVMVVQDVNILPIEVVVRGYLSGSAWRDYAAGKAISGIRLPQGMKNSQKLERPLLTPSIKAPKGEHDEPISEEEIIKSGKVEPKIWEEVRQKAFALFELGTKEAAKQGLILVDTKYEFGLRNGRVILADEIHTLDSSRFWIAKSYPERFAKGEVPEMLDKEPIRQWLISKGFMGSGPIPEFTDDHRVELAKHYLNSARLVTGREVDAQVGDVLKRVEKVLRAL